MIITEFALSKDALQRASIIERERIPGDNLLVQVIDLTYGRARITVTDGMQVFSGW